MSSATKRLLAATAVALPVAVLGVFGWSVLGVGKGEELPVLWEAPDFALVDQAGDTLRGRELRGTAWVAHFFFTDCAGLCPLTEGRVVKRWIGEVDFGAPEVRRAVRQTLGAGSRGPE